MRVIDSISMYRHQRPKSHATLLLVGAGVFLIGAALLAWRLRGQETAIDDSINVRPSVEMDQAAPQLALTDLQGGPVSLDT